MISAKFQLFFPSLFAGPSFDYAEYNRWLDTTMFDVNIPAKDGQKAKRRRKIPSSSRPAAFKAVYGIFWIAAFVYFSGVYPESFGVGEEYKNYSFPRK